MRLMSFSMTTRQMDESTPGHELKKRSRRDGTGYRVGETRMAVDRCMGLKKGEHPRHIHPVEFVTVEREPLMDIVRRPYRNGHYEVEEEGFPEWIGQEMKFVEMYLSHRPKRLRDPEMLVSNIGFRHIWETPVTRVEFEHLRQVWRCDQCGTEWPESTVMARAMIRDNARCDCGGDITPVPDLWVAEARQ